ncbi:MAG: 2-C-methyl-D-erythritol 2,4-cyclodiphosphate synthase [Gammaproteobacteria bacterium]|nr:2-C-methyl-D-erythritol 2,4-cyclodiphosphate synthase [Gammaproteobacteria bacterium]
MFRIGHGYDAHCFEEGRPLVLGGVRIPSSKGMKAHSDGDVILHAICDALLGAAALGDIGQHFPDTQKEYANIDSRILLRQVAALVTDNNYHINNVDVTVLAQTPKLAPYIAEMRRNIANELLLTFNDVNVKATTTEKMGFIGREEGIACYAVTLLMRKTK